MLPPPPQIPVSLEDSLRYSARCKTYVMSSHSDNSMTMSRMQLTKSQSPPPALTRIEDEEENDYLVPQGVCFDGMRKTGVEDDIMMSSDEEDDYCRDYDDRDDEDYDDGL